MSGVVYALAGFVWICGKYNPASGLYLNRQSVIILLVWLVVCFTGVLGAIANAASFTAFNFGFRVLPTAILRTCIRSKTSSRILTGNFRSWSACFLGPEEIV